LQACGPRLRISVHRYGADFLTVEAEDRAAIRIAKAVRLLQYRIEYRRQIARRGVDDLQYFGGRGLLLQRLTRLGQEPRVFHRDHRLISESAHEFDLLFCKRLDQLARERDHPNRFAFAE